MLRARRRLHRLAFALQTFYKCHAEAAGEIRVLPVRLMTASPARIAENIYIRGPERQPLINVTVFLCCIGIVFRTSLRRNHISNLTEQRIVKGCAKPDRLRKYRCLSGSRHAVKRLVPPVIRRNPKSLNCRGVIAELTRLFLHCHLRDQRFRPFSCVFSFHILPMFPFSFLSRLFASPQRQKSQLMSHKI